jgi:hypothetical protein
MGRHCHGLEQPQVAGVVSPQQVGNLLASGLDVHSSAGDHGLDVGPVLGAGKEGFEHQEVLTGQHRDPVLVERHPSDPSGCLSVERVVSEEDIDWGVVPKQPNLPIAADRGQSLFAGLHRTRQCLEHVLCLSWVHEDIDIDSHCAPGLAGAVGECDGPAEGMRDVCSDE